MPYEFRQMTTRREREQFLTLAWQFYKDDPVWAPPNMLDYRKRIDPKRGAWFQRGEAEFYLLQQEGKPIGRFSIGIDHAANRKGNKREAVMGFFEVIEDYAAAQAIFQFCQRWAREHGMRTVYGPFNLDYEDAYGLVIQGWEEPLVMLCAQNPRYYLDHFQRYGWQPGRPANIAMRIDLTRPRPEFERLRAMADKLRAADLYAVRSPDFRRWQEEIDVLHNLLNRALAHLEGHIPWERAAVEALVEPFRLIADPEMLLFIVDKRSGETIGFLPATPDMNEHFRRFDGLRHWWNYPGFLLNMRKPTDCLTIKSVLLLPEYWGSGAAILLFDEMRRRVLAKGHSSWIDLSLTAVDNPQTPKLGKKLGAEIYRMYQVFRIEAGDG
jgi:hypothetical protein